MLGAVIFFILFNQEKKKRKEETKKQSPRIKGFSLGPSLRLLKLNQMSPDPRQDTPCPNPPGGTHHEIALGDCPKNPLAVFISVHLSFLNSCYTNMAQCIKIPIENNENSVSK